ncbi:MAG: DUF454 family protein [Thermoanaerobaculia bacterium]
MTAAHRATPPHRRRTRNIVLGIAFFVLGVIGVLIPVMPQIPFFVMSALFFSLVSPRLRRALRRWRHRHPKVDQAYRSWRHKARRRRRQRIHKKRRSSGEHGPRGHAGGERS